MRRRRRGSDNLGAAGVGGIQPITGPRQALAGPAVVSLSAVKSGGSGTILSMHGGCGFRARLVSMGLNVGSEITVLRGSDVFGGPTLLAVGNARLAIGRGMAEMITVSLSARQ